MRVLGTRYVLHELLGQGTTGEVWRATRRDDGTDVAVKMLRPEFADDQIVVDRFLREWQILYDINSPELVRVLDLVNEPDALAIVMELVDGPDLREYLRHEAPLPVADAIHIVTQVLWALDTVHNAGVVHRDVKPENVLLDEHHGAPLTIRLTDFGIARMVDTLNRNKTSATGPIGTPLYMAPELGTGGQPTPAADLYSTGILLYELLAGMPPFDETHPTDMLRAHLEQEPLPIKGVPHPIWDILATLLAKNPRHRPQTAATAAHALQKALHTTTPDTTHTETPTTTTHTDTPHQRRDSDTWEHTTRTDPLADSGTQRLTGITGRVTAAGTRAKGGPLPADDVEATNELPTVGRAPQDDELAAAAGPRAGRPRSSWDDGATSLIPAGDYGPDDHRSGDHRADNHRPGDHRRDDWAAYDDAPTSGQPVRVPSRAGASRSDRNTIISAIPASSQPALGARSGGRPPAGNSRQRMRVAAGAAFVVALLAGAGGWALAAAGNGSPDPVSTATSTATADGGATSGAVLPTTTAGPGGTGTPTTASPSASRSTQASHSASASATRASATASRTAEAPTTSAAATSATVPGVVGESQSAAVAAIENAGFAAPAVSQECASTVAAGQVQSQSPASGTTAALSTTITLVVATDCTTTSAPASTSGAPSGGTGPGDGGGRGGGQ